MRRALPIVVAAIAVALAVNAIVTDRQTAEAEVDADGGTVLRLPGPDLHVRDRGPANAPAVVLLHCYTCSLHYWERLETLLGEHRRAISIDLPGHGGSEKPRDGYEIERQADGVAAALRRLGVRHALVAGQSLGGLVATALAERHPGLVRGVVVMGSPPADEGFGDLPVTARLAQTPVIGHAIKRLAPEAVVRDSLADAFHDGFEIPDRFVEDVRRMTFRSFARIPDRADEYVRERTLDDRLAATGVPLLAIYGAEDGIVDPAAADEFRDVPGAQVEILPGVGHTPQVEAPARTASLIRRFDPATQR